MSGQADVLILSGTYLEPALTAEFGRVPPSFLPVGTRRLFEEQIAFAAHHGQRIAMTLPDDFVPSTADAAILARAKVRIVPLPAALSLADALSGGIDALEAKERLIVLFGDTLVEYEGDETKPDTFATGPTSHFAVWAGFEADADGTTNFSESLTRGDALRDVACGLFDFSDATHLRACLGAERKFFGALNRYGRTYPLRALKASRWLDFGHLHTYYQSRKTALAARVFNEVKGCGGVVRKSGAEPRKIFAEAEWYRRLPASLKTFTPQFIGLEAGPGIAYEIEYLFLPALSELYCFGKLPPGLWRGIFASTRELLEHCQAIRPAPHEVQAGFAGRFFADMIAGKTVDRLSRFADGAGIDRTRPWTINGDAAPSLDDLVAALLRIVGPTQESDVTLWHGDFHFANLLFDFRARRVKCIDPRGMLSDGTVTMYGDARYDVAKLTHSVIGLYDFLVAGRYALDASRPYAIDLAFDLPPDVVEIQNRYRTLHIGRYDVASPQILALSALLFLSMLPLHSDSRTKQLAMLANGFRLAKLAGAA
jgi:hypothetical protein